MSFFTRKRKIEPAWSYRVKGLVWRVLSAGPMMFVGEDRVPEAKRVSFFGVNRLSGEVLWENVSFDERWWISIEAAYRDRVFLHGFSRPDMPDHQRILALDLMTGRVAWSRDDVRYLFASDDSVFTSQDTITGRALFELRLHDGGTVRSWDNDTSEVNAARSRARALERGGPEFPVPLSDMPTPDYRLGPVYELSRNENIVGPVEILVKDSLCLFSYHEKSDAAGLLKNTLAVMNMQDGVQLFATTIDEKAQSVVPDSFFVQDGMLYFVRDRSTLSAVNIGELS